MPDGLQASTVALLKQLGGAKKGKGKGGGGVFFSHYVAAFVYIGLYVSVCVCPSCRSPRLYVTLLSLCNICVCMSDFCNFCEKLGSMSLFVTGSIIYV